MVYHGKFYLTVLLGLCALGCGDKSVNTSEATSSTTAGPPTDGESTFVDSTTISESSESLSEGSSESSVGTTTDDSTGAPTTEPVTTDDTCPAFVSCGWDMAPPPTCNTYDEDCEEGQKCMPWADDGGSAWNALKCVDITGDGSHGDPCTVEDNGLSGIDDCGLHHMCWGIDPDTLMGHCIAFCDGTPEQPSCAPANTTCVIANNNTLNICLPTCDPLVQACPEGEGCYPSDNGYICAPNSASEDSGLEGDACNFINNCQPGFACTDAENLLGCMANACCSPVCDLNAPDPCPNPETMCRPIFGEEQDYAHAGYCGVPVCDPLLQNCSAGFACYPIDDSYNCEEVLVENTGFEGDPCSVANHCQPGFTCVVPEQLLDCMDFKCCSPLCDLTAQDPCPNPETACIAVYEDNLDYPDTGFCGVMP